MFVSLLRAGVIDSFPSGWGGIVFSIHERSDYFTVRKLECRQCLVLCLGCDLLIPSLPWGGGKDTVGPHCHLHYCRSK